MRRESAASSAGTTTPVSAVISGWLEEGGLRKARSVGWGLMRPKELRAWFMLGGGARFDFMEVWLPLRAGGGGACWRGWRGPPKRSFEDPESGRAGLAGLTGAKGEEGRGFWPVSDGSACWLARDGKGFWVCIGGKCACNCWLVCRLGLGSGLERNDVGVLPRESGPRNGGISGIDICSTLLGVGLRC